MKSILVFATADERTKQLLAPYRLPSFLGCLRSENIDPVVVELTDDVQRRLRSDPPRVVHTLGDAALLSSTWRSAAQAGCLVAHSVTGNPGIRTGQYLWTRNASRYVQAILGSNRASIRDCIEAGLFPRAKFSMITLPPVEIPTSSEPRVQSHVASLPTFGYRAPDGADSALDFLFAAVRLTGNQHLFRLLIGGRVEASTSGSHQFANISFHRIDQARSFVRSVDALIVPESDDRVIEDVVLALRDDKVVVAPEGGTISELLQFGRNGVLFRAGAPYDLAMAINNVTDAWTRPPFDFKGAESVISLTSPREVARTFARAYRRLEDPETAAARGGVV